MVSNKRLEEQEFSIALLHSFVSLHGNLFDERAFRLTAQKVRSRVRSEGVGFLTKSLPKLGKAFDLALSSNTPLNITSLGFKTAKGTNLPRFLGELFREVLDPITGMVLQDPCPLAIKSIRQICYCFYKYQLPYTHDQEKQVLDRFEATERELEDVEGYLGILAKDTELDTQTRGYRRKAGYTGMVQVTRTAKVLLARVLSGLDITNIEPRHGPGVVSTGERLWEKYEWTNVSDRITEMYPLDAYFYASKGHVCDSYRDMTSLTGKSHPARVLLVPKDSRGPRLISCEPLDNQWIQQGIRKRLVEHIEHHPLTAGCVFFTDQEPNQRAALNGSIHGRLATLDLKDASDRVSWSLVQLLWPSHIADALRCCRSESTVLPDGRELKLRKFAPMGSALCFPVMALTIWALLAAGLSGSMPDKYQECIHVYGDDIIVPTENADEAMIILERFGLRVNRDKSCTKGFFRESCGVDAFKGVNVTPLRVKTVWSQTPAAESYAAYIAYAKSLWHARYYEAYHYVVDRLAAVYGVLPLDPGDESLPESLPYVPDTARPLKRWNRHLQKYQYRVLVSEAVTVEHAIDGWSMLLRYFTEKSVTPAGVDRLPCNMYRGWTPFQEPMSVSKYTERHRSKLRWRWR